MDDRIKSIYDTKQGKGEGQAENRGSKTKQNKRLIGKIHVLWLKWSEVVVRELEDDVSRVDNYAG